MERKLLFLFVFVLVTLTAHAQDQAAISETLSFEEIGTMYPNPVSNELTINNLINSVFRVRIFNILGDAVLETEVTLSSTKVDVSSLPSGIYITAFYLGDQTYTQRLVKE